MRPRACLGCPSTLEHWPLFVCLTNTRGIPRIFSMNFSARSLAGYLQRALRSWFADFGHQSKRPVRGPVLPAGNFRVAGCPKSGKRTSKSPYVGNPNRSLPPIKFIEKTLYIGGCICGAYKKGPVSNVGRTAINKTRERARTSRFLGFPELQENI